MEKDQGRDSESSPFPDSNWLFSIWGLNVPKDSLYPGGNNFPSQGYIGETFCGLCKGCLWEKNLTWGGGIHQHDTEEVGHATVKER